MSCGVNSDKCYRTLLDHVYLVVRCLSDSVCVARLWNAEREEWSLEGHVPSDFLISEVERPDMAASPVG